VEVDEITRKLYGADPGQFTAARAEAAAQARDRGDAKGAAEIAKLRKPTVGAWAVNLLAIHKPDLLQQLADLASQLRQAQRDLQGAQLRELAKQRRVLIPQLVTEAQRLAGKAKLPLFEVEATLGAALADEQVAATIQSGRLLKTVSYTGLGEMVVAEEPVRADNRELKQAREAEAKAHNEMQRSEAAELAAAQQLEALDNELHELRQRRADLAETLNQARHALRFAQRALTAASRRVHELDPSA
jgi:DNA repair exonuclease SbcCD ATPase subunit